MSAPAIPDRDAPPLTYLTQALIDLRQRRAAAVKRHEQELADFDAAIRQTERERDLVMRGADLEQVRLAESVMYVEQPKNVSRGDGRSVTAKAIADLVAGIPELRHSYFGTKVYDRWDGQAEGGHYGTGPRHGSTIFAIGLREEVRKRDPVALDPDETEACVRYLYALLGD